MSKDFAVLTQILRSSGHKSSARKKAKKHEKKNFYQNNNRDFFQSSKTPSSKQPSNKRSENSIFQEKAYVMSSAYLLGMIQIHPSIIEILRQIRLGPCEWV